MSTMIPSTLFLVAVAATLFDLVIAHGFVRGVNINSKFTNGSDPNWYYYQAGTSPVTAGWDALNQDIGFVEPASFATADINCHKSATAGKAYVSANAGDSVQFVWFTWPDSHKGPIINYIAPCNGECTTLTSSALKWTKISQAALVTPSTNTWVTDTLIENSFVSTTILPKNLKPGNYVVRHEIIALHSAYDDNGAQAYPQCLNFKIGGSGTVAPTAGVSGSSLYTRNDPGIKFNIYAGATNYPYPGPPVWTGAN